MRIEKITAEGFPPFGNLNINLPEPERAAEGDRLGEVQLFTGPNGTGKSRLLAGVAACAGYLKPLRDRLGKIQKSGRIVVEGLAVDVDSQKIRNDLDETFVGTPIEYEEKLALRAALEADLLTASVFLTSEEGISTAPSTISDSVLLFARAPSAWLTHSQVTFLQSVAAPTQSERLSFTPESGHGKDLLQAIANVKARSLNDFQKHMGKPGAKLSKVEKLIAGIETELSNFFGVHIFFRTDVERSSLLIDWGEVEDMDVGQAPDGLRAVLGWLVDIIMMTHLLRPESANPMHEEMVILLDEPETHLHPAWQRKIIPLAQRLLPNAQLLISTHSPFVVMSVNEGWIHRLEPQPDGSVKALEPMKASPGDSYIHVMREVMNIPQRFDEESESIMAAFRAAKDRAMDGEENAVKEATALLGRLALRGEELSWIARAELDQMENELKDPMPA